MKFFLIFKIIIIPLMIWIVLNQKIRSSLMRFSWTHLLRFQQIFFFVIFFLMTFLTEKFYLEMPELIWSVILNSIFNIGVYYLVYHYLVPQFYFADKYPVFVLYALICFLLSGFFRILWEQVLFDLHFSTENSHLSFLYNVYLYQGSVILVASFLGITKDKFLIERNMMDLSQPGEELYPHIIKSTLNPQFLFNTLNNIYAGSMTGSVSTSESILQLSKLLQYIIYDSEKEKISVVQELSSVKAFAELYQLKYNNQLDLTFEVSNKEILELMEVPPFLFLSLFDAALKYSAIGENPESFIRITCKTDNASLFYEIINSSDKTRNLPMEESGGLGNKEVIHLLEKHYPEKFDFFSEQDRDCHYKTILKIDVID